MAASFLSAAIVVPLAVDEPSTRLLLAVLPGVLSNLHWGLIHEAIHGHLFSEPRRNERIGRWLAIAFGTPLAPLRFAHLRHHRYNRTALSRDDVYDPAVTPTWRAQIRYYLYLCGGLYVAELMLVPLALAPRSWITTLVRASTPRGTAHPPALDDLARHVLLNHRELRRYRFDALMVVAIFGFAAYCWRSQPSGLIALLALRALLISVMDNAAHYGTPLEQRRYALNLRAPSWLSGLLLNFNFHRRHHLEPATPWSGLPLGAEMRTDDPSLVLAVLRQFKGAMSVDQVSTGPLPPHIGTTDDTCAR